MFIEELLLDDTAKDGHWEVPPVEVVSVVVVSEELLDVLLLEVESSVLDSSATSQAVNRCAVKIIK